MSTTDPIPTRIVRVPVEGRNGPGVEARVLGRTTGPVRSGSPMPGRPAELLLPALERAMAAARGGESPADRINRQGFRHDDGRPFGDDDVAELVRVADLNPIVIGYWPRNSIVGAALRR